jgi:hypothetical protein
MAARWVREGFLYLAAVGTLASSGGCSVFIQNRYSVFGFDGLQTESAEQARTWSLLLLASVAVVSAALGADCSWLGKRWFRHWREKLGNDSFPEGRRPEEVTSEASKFRNVTEETHDWTCRTGG